MTSLINPDSPAGAAFAEYCSGDLNIGDLSELERAEFASCARMWLDIPAIAEPRAIEDAALPVFLADFISELENYVTRRAPIGYVSKCPRELEIGEIVNAHGMLCLVVEAPKLSTSHAIDERGGCYWTQTLVLNRDAVSSDAVPYSFTLPREVWSDEHRRWITPEGPHVWTLQGNNLARESVVVLGPELPRCS